MTENIDTPGINLLPCPFCGTKPVMGQYARNGVFIKCPKCIIQYKQKTLRYSIEWLEKSMAETWNTRTTPPQDSDAVELLDWVKNNAYHKDGSWYLHKDMSGEIYTSEQIFLKSKTDKK